LVSRFVCFAPTAPSLPQAVYAYFEPTPKALAAAGGPAGRAELAGEADANRWGLYYGVKHLARENDEAKFFWAFLDESHGEDYVAFFLHCLSTLEKVAGDVVTKQFSSTFAAADYGALDAKVAAHYEAIAAEERKKAAQEEEGGEGSPAASAVKTPAPPAIGGGLVKDVPPPPPEDEEGGQQVVWAELAHACEAVEAILVNAKLPARRKAITQTKSLAVGADGRIDRWGSSAMQCVDVAVWLRVMMNAYKDEQVHRKVRRNRLAVVNNDVAPEGSISSRGRDESHTGHTIWRPPPSTPLHRKAAVRLMFETALAGTVATAPPLYGPDAVLERRPLEDLISAEAKPPTIDLPQCLSIARTLWPGVSTSEACALYRDAHEETGGKVDYEAFLKVRRL
jgi:hypothetical protein